MKPALAVLIAVIVVGFGAKIVVQALHDRKLAATVINEVDLSKVPDGVFSGTYDVFPVSVEVKVTVKAHSITGVDLVKYRNGQGWGAETIPAKVAKAQSLKVDTVSGATISSKVILKAIENALDGGSK